MQMIRILVTFCFVLSLSSFVKAQSITENAIDLGFSFGFNTPLVDLKERFGAMYGGNLSLNHYMGTSGSQIGIKLGFLTSDAVREDVLASYRDSEGQLLSQDGVVTTVNTRMASSYVGVDFQKNLLNFGKKEHAKVFAGLGVGIMQHKIRFIEFTQTVPLATEDYAKGHGRNVRGPYIDQQIGVKVRQERKKFDLSIVAFQGFLKPAGAIQFDTGLRDNERRLDAAIGIQVKWYISLSARESGKDIYY